MENEFDFDKVRFSHANKSICVRKESDLIPDIIFLSNPSTKISPNQISALNSIRYGLEITELRELANLIKNNLKNVMEEYPEQHETDIMVSLKGKLLTKNKQKIKTINENRKIQSKIISYFRNSWCHIFNSCFDSIYFNYNYGAS
ncbi:hypothetical protein [Algibacter sp. 2305UL17-15]|uniref:hypothetical protein n=1 Tax=Algibacter sp. 2305UL17-15 TaxID=3231268 RepID=UPI00345AB0F3